LILAFDNDEAGKLATERSIDLAEANDFSVKVLDLAVEDLKDPADIVKNKPGLLITLLPRAREAMRFYFDRYLMTAEKNIHLQKKNIRLVLSRIKNISSPIVRNHWIKELASLINLEEKFLFEEMENLKTRNYAETGQGAADESRKETEKASRRDLVSQRVIGLALGKDKYRETLRDYQGYLPHSYQTIFVSCLNNEIASLSPQSKDVFDLINLRSALNYGSVDETKIEMEFYDLLKQLKKEYFKERQGVLNKEIEEAEKSGNGEAYSKLLKEFEIVSRELHNL
jgi:DNA primase